MIDYASEKIHTETPTAVVGEEGLTYEDWPPRDLNHQNPAGYVGGPVPPPPSGDTSGTSGNASGDDSPSDVGSSVTDPWVPGISTVITQQWGATDYSGEPSGHGSPHWHAGVDLGYDTATIIQFPNDQTWLEAVTQWLAQLPGGIGTGALAAAAPGGTFHQGVWNGSDKYVPDPEGYGSHAATLTIGNVDIILGHGMAYHAQDGATVRPGDALISVDTEGNASGPHLHFEVRPKQGAYGTDVDPWTMLTSGQASSLQTPTAGIGSDVEAAAATIGSAIQQAESDAVNLAVGVAMAGGGAALIGLSAYIAFRGFQVPSVQTLTPRRSPPARTEPPAHPEARIARATRAGPARPRIPSRPADAQPVIQSSRAASRAGVAPRASMRDEMVLRSRARTNARSPNRPTSAPF